MTFFILQHQKCAYTLLVNSRISLKLFKLNVLLMYLLPKKLLTLIGVQKRHELSQSYVSVIVT